LFLARRPIGRGSPSRASRSAIQIQVIEQKDAKDAKGEVIRRRRPTNRRLNDAFWSAAGGNIVHCVIVPFRLRALRVLLFNSEYSGPADQTECGFGTLINGQIANQSQTAGARNDAPYLLQRATGDERLATARDMTCREHQRDSRRDDTDSLVNVVQPEAGSNLSRGDCRPWVSQSKSACKSRLAHVVRGRTSQQATRHGHLLRMSEL